MLLHSYVRLTCNVISYAKLQTNALRWRKIFKKSARFKIKYLIEFQFYYQLVNHFLSVFFLYLCENKLSTRYVYNRPPPGLGYVKIHVLYQLSFLYADAN